MDEPLTFLDEDAVLAYLQDEAINYPLPNIEELVTEVSDVSTMTSTTTEERDTEERVSATPYLTKRGQISLLLNGHIFTKKYAKKNGSTVWRCNNRTCKGRITTSTADHVVTSTLPHIEQCQPLDNTETQSRAMRSSIIFNQTTSSTRDLAHESQHPYSGPEAELQGAGRVRKRSIQGYTINRE